MAFEPQLNAEMEKTKSDSLAFHCSCEAVSVLVLWTTTTLGSLFSKLET
jgi:hypothetical protein